MDAPEAENIYFRLNADLRMLAAGTCDRTSVIDTWAPLMTTLLPALRTLPPFAGVVYRGLPENVAAVYTAGKQVRFSAFTSATTSADTAWEAARAGEVDASRSTVLRLHIQSGRQLLDLSVFPAEDEVLLLPNTTFAVSSAPHVATRLLPLSGQRLRATEIDLVELTGESYQY